MDDGRLEVEEGEGLVGGVATGELAGNNNLLLIYYYYYYLLFSSNLISDPLIIKIT